MDCLWRHCWFCSTGPAPNYQQFILLLLWQLWPWREITKIQNVVNNDFARKGFCDYENFFFLPSRRASKFHTRGIHEHCVCWVFQMGSKTTTKRNYGNTGTSHPWQEVFASIEKVKKILKNMTFNMLNEIICSVLFHIIMSLHKSLKK